MQSPLPQVFFYVEIAFGLRGLRLTRPACGIAQLVALAHPLPADFRCRDQPLLEQIEGLRGSVPVYLPMAAVPQTRFEVLVRHVLSVIVGLQTRPNALMPRGSLSWRSPGNLVLGEDTVTRGSAIGR